MPFWRVLPFFPKDFRGSDERKNPSRFGGFPCRFPKKQGKEDQGSFRALEKKEFPLFFPVGQPRPAPSPKPTPAGCLFSTRKSRSEVPERGDFGEEDCLGKGGVDRAKKRMRKKGEKLKFPISLAILLEIINLGLLNSPQKIGVWWVARLKFSISRGPEKAHKLFQHKLCGPHPTRRI